MPSAALTEAICPVSGSVANRSPGTFSIVCASWPSLAPGALVAGDLAATTDYRDVIGEILQKRCGFGALDTVFPTVAPSSFGLAVAR